MDMGAIDTAMGTDMVASPTTVHTHDDSTTTPFTVSTLTEATTTTIILSIDWPRKMPSINWPRLSYCDFIYTWFFSVVTRQTAFEHVILDTTKLK